MDRTKAETIACVIHLIAFTLILVFGAGAWYALMGPLGAIPWLATVGLYGLLAGGVAKYFNTSLE